MSDFSDRELIAGEFRGLRAFEVDGLGRLKGPSFGGIFQPGVNEAKCGGDSPAGALAVSIQRAFTRTLSHMTYRNTVAGDVNDAPAAVTEPVQPPHVLAGKDCACGYYAYFDGGNDYAQPGRVSGIIAGTGTVTAGKRGFRASKAELVALVRPGRDGRHHPAWYDRLADWLQKRSLGAPIGVACLVGGVATFIVGVGLTLDVSPLFAPLILLGAGLALSVGVIFKADFHGIDRRFPMLHDLHTCHDKGAKKGGVDWDLLRRNYPDVPVYPSVQAALAAHPLTPPPPPPEPTPDDPDFWTRPAVTE